MATRVLRTSVMFAWIAALAVPLGCGEPRSGEDKGLSPITTAGPSDTDAGMESESETHDTGGTRLDVGGQDVPSSECASVSQMTTVEDRPNDLVMIGDPEANQKLLQAAAANIGPQLWSQGIDDTRIIFIAGSAPPIATGPVDEEYNCGNWTCWDEDGIPKLGHFEILERDVGPDTLLTDLLDLQDDWVPMTRPNAWKHIWATTSRTKDAELSVDEFTAAFASIGPGFEDFIFHAGQPEGSAHEDFIELAERSGGESFPEPDGGGSVYTDFADAVAERLAQNLVSCRVEIPPPPEGMTFRRDHVNVDYDDGAGARTIGNVQTFADCRDVSDGWYYDDPLAPSVIHMCPQTCDFLQSRELLQLDVRFGCVTTAAG